MHCFADYEKEKMGKRIRDIIRKMESITVNTEVAKKRLRYLDRAAIQTKRVVAEEMMILQDCEDEVRDNKPGSEKECKKSRKDHNGTKRRLSEDETRTGDESRAKTGERKPRIG